VSDADSHPHHTRRERPTDQVEYDLSAWPTEWHAGLELMLEGGGIPFEWDGPGILVAPRARQTEVDGLVDYIEAGDSVVGVGTADDLNVEDPFPPWLRPAGEPASPGRRILGALLDTVLGGFILTAFLAPWPGDEPTGVAAVLAVWMFHFLYVVPGTAIAGRTIGKLAMDTKVVLAGTDAPPGWRAAIIRWIVPALPSALGWLGNGPALDWIGFVWFIVVYGPIFGRHRRGLHDLAANTMVVNA
jgi:uncharacterized RDD family membrane protein YckC